MFRESAYDLEFGTRQGEAFAGLRDGGRDVGEFPVLLSKLVTFRAPPPQDPTRSWHTVRSGTGGGRRGGAAGVSHWQDHWRQCLFVFGDGHSPAVVSSRMLTRGVPVTMIASHNDTSISFSIDTGCRRRVSRK